MNKFLEPFVRHPIIMAAIFFGSAAVVGTATSFITSSVQYNEYVAKYDSEKAEKDAQYPHAPQSVFKDNDFVTYDANGESVASTKSTYQNAQIYYARDAKVAPLSTAKGHEYRTIDETKLGECITGLNRRGGAITFEIETDSYGLSDIDIALCTSWYDEKGELHALENLTDYIKIQVNGIDVKTEEFDLPEDGEFQHLILGATHLVKGHNVLKFGTDAYNTFGNKDDVLYVMPDIRNVTVITDADILPPNTAE